MKILVAHNAYQQSGGEDAVVKSEIALLRDHGHEVFEYNRHNDELARIFPVRTAAATLWSRRTSAEIGAICGSKRPEVLHVHNTFPLISPSLYWAAAKADVPVVQTLHNFRLLCPQAMLLREGHVCEICIGRTPLSGVRHACYRSSRGQTAVLTSMLLLHRAMGTFSHKVARYIALSEFARAKFVEGGLPAPRIVVKPNFVNLPAPPSGARRGLLYVGRLSHEKGIAVLAAAAKALTQQGSLTIAGTGPAKDILTDSTAIDAVGLLNTDQVTAAMCGAVALVVPSICYENFPRTLVEAFACGLPVLASRLGSLAELVDDGVTGLHFEAGNSTDLAIKMQWALAHPERMAEMGHAARLFYERHYTADINYARLLTIYREAIASRARH